jgi:thiamine transport system substrate-binding protein
MHRITRLLAVVLAVMAAACGGDDSSDGTSITVLAHDSFAISEEALATFTEETGISVRVQTLGDTGTMVSEAILTVGNPLGDVMFGIDNTFLQRGLDAELFEAYESANLDGVIAGLDLDPQHRVTPIDFGDVCVNYWIDAIPGAAPATLDDLTDPANADQLVVQNPETSSPGLAFLLATIAATPDWEQYWTDLRANGVSVTSGWEDAYYGEFVAGGGDRSMVVSYASSPPAEVIFAVEPIDTPPTGVLLDSCFRQIEFAGVLAGTENSAGAQAFIDFLLTPTFQEEIPLSMFVFPALEAAELPQEFVDHAKLAESPHLLDPAEIEANRDAWIDRWVEIVLG